MLQELSIKNFAIIDDLRIRFSDGLIVLSGETGSGKSIIINAVNLLLGSRASTQLIRTGAEQAELEALFEIVPKSRAARRMQQQDFDPAEGLLIRRIISRNDRHRVYINGRLSTMQVLKEMTQNLASISGQHAHQGLLKEDRQLRIIDQFGELLPIRRRVQEYHQQIMPLIEELASLIALKNRQSDHMDLLQFQQKEIQAASITPGEDAKLEQEAQMLKHAETLYECVHDSLEMLYDAPGAVVEKLMAVGKDMDRFASIDVSLKDQADVLKNAAFAIEAVVDDLRSYAQHIQMDEQRLETVQARLDALNKLKRKYGDSLEAVLARGESIQTELQTVENLSEQIAKVEKALSELQEKAGNACEELSARRHTAAEQLCREAEKELASLKMEATTFSVRFDTVAADNQANPYLVWQNRLMTESGMDRAAFMIAPNVGEALKPMADIASGGELSRIVLALKVILAGTESVETIVFDEVDAGIGGEVAAVVGKKLNHLSKTHQVICITHLPQIAKFARHHFRIDKKVCAGRTATTIEHLNSESRIQEIARMLGGEKITAKTLAHAKELVMSDEK
ncbi:MAG: DNA repair protein RecN [Deltaproteobacteria bacterium]